MEKAHYMYNKSGCCKQLNPMRTKEHAMKMLEDKRFNFIYLGFITEEEAKEKINW